MEEKMEDKVEEKILLEDEIERKGPQLFREIVECYYGGEKERPKIIFDHIYQLLGYKELADALTDQVGLIIKLSELIGNIFFKRTSIKRNYFFYVDLDYSNEELRYINALKDVWVALYTRILYNLNHSDKQDEINTLLDLVKKQNSTLNTFASKLIDFHRSKCGFFRLGSTTTRNYLDLVLCRILDGKDFDRYFNPYKESSAVTFKNQHLTR